MHLDIEGALFIPHLHQKLSVHVDHLKLFPHPS